MDAMNRLFLTGLQYLYGAHQQGARQAAANVETSTLPRLKAAVKSGSKQNLVQAKRLEKIFKKLGAQPTGHADEGMKGIIDANNARIARASDPYERDLINIALGQTAAHFYLAKYGSLRSLAEELGYTTAVGLLQKTMNETGAIDKKLSGLAHEVLTRMDPKKKVSLLGKLLSTVTALGAITTLVASTLPVIAGAAQGNNSQE